MQAGKKVLSGLTNLHLVRRETKGLHLMNLIEKPKRMHEVNQPDWLVFRVEAVWYQGDIRNNWRMPYTVDFDGELELEAKECLTNKDSSPQ